MKTKPILFSTQMVEAILSGRKTMTRRVIRPQPSKYDTEKIVNWNEVIYPTPKFLKGDILWVRETFTYDSYFQDNSEIIIYKADDPNYPLNSGQKWKPSIFMPKEACRIFLKITDIKVERLQDISEEDAIKEGVKIDYIGSYRHCYGFVDLWKSINGEQSWIDNPFVWVISFERIEKPEKF